MTHVFDWSFVRCPFHIVTGGGITESESLDGGSIYFPAPVPLPREFRLFSHPGAVYSPNRQLKDHLVPLFLATVASIFHHCIPSGVPVRLAVPDRLWSWTMTASRSS